MKTSTELRKELKEALKRERAEKKLRPHRNSKWVPDPTKISKEDTIKLCAKRSPQGFTRANLATLGVPWPPPPNWKTRLVHAAAEFHGIKNVRGEAGVIRKMEKIGKIESRPEFAPPERKVFTKRVTPESIPWNRQYHGIPELNWARCIKLPNHGGVFPDNFSHIGQKIFQGTEE